jgi:hypothetical protein
MGFSYAHISIENTPHGFTLSQIECMNADKGTEEKINATVNLEQNRSLYLRAKIADGDQTTFFYSLNGKDYEQLGTTFTAKSGRWMGTRMGLFITRPKQLNDGGWIDVDFFRIDK